VKGRLIISKKRSAIGAREGRRSVEQLVLIKEAKLEGEDGCWDPRRHPAEHVSCVVELFDALTGETAAFQECVHRGSGEDDVDAYMWTEGNYNWDDNRHLFFERALGRNPTLHEAIAENYGDEPRYHTRITRLDSGAVVLDEISQFISSGN